MLDFDELFDEPEPVLAETDRRFVGLRLTREATHDITLFAGPGAADRAREHAEMATRREGRDELFGRFLSRVQFGAKAVAEGNQAASPAAAPSDPSP